MPWNEPGSKNQNDSGSDKDPWGAGNNNQRPNGNRDGNQPPDLDEVIQNITNKINAMFGSKKGGSNNGGGNNSNNNAEGPGFMSIGLMALVALAIWVVSGFYTVEEGKKAVVLRFGAYHQTNDSGLSWRPRFIDTVQQVDVSTYNTVEVGYRANSTNQKQKQEGESLMLTEDENIIDIELAVQYNINDPTKLLFNVVSGQEEDVVRQSTESAIREIVGRNTMDFAITDGRGPLANEIKSLLQVILDRYETGINVLAVELQNAQPPAQVKSAFDDVVKAREDREKFKNQAETYANGIIPKARGEAAKQIQIAEGYKESVIARAEGDAKRFQSILAEYSKAPEITRDRLYIEAMEEVLSKSSKLYMDSGSGDGSNVFYLPLDKLVQESNNNTRSAKNDDSQSQLPTQNFEPLSTLDSAVELPASSQPRINTNRQARNSQ